jgi:DNA repair protein RecO
MDETYRFKGVVLSRQAYREHDLLVEVLSEEQGKLRLVARGAKKFKSKVAAHVEPLCLIEAMAIRGRREDYLGSALTDEVFAIIKGDLDRLRLASEAVNLLRRLIREGEPVGRIFRYLVEYLTYLNQPDIAPGKFQADLFAVSVLKSLGLLNNLTISQNCANLIKILDSSFIQILAKKVSKRAKLAQEISQLAQKSKEL